MAARVHQETRVAYTKLLEEHPVESYSRALEVLAKPLGGLLFSLYQRRHAGLPMEVDRFSDEGCVFLYDSGGAYLEGGVNRLVGAIARSRERVGFDELLDRLREQRDRGLPTAETIDLIKLTLSAHQDASRRRSRALNRAYALLFGTDRLPIPELVERIVAPLRTPARPIVALLRRLARELRLALAKSGAAAGGTFRIEVGQEITAAVLEPLRQMARAAESELPASSRAALIDRILDYVPEGGALAVRLRQPVTDELLAAIRLHLGPILRSKLRPRDARAQRNARLPRGTVHAYDVGHFVPHVSGGPANINFFRQERRLNRGWSEAGRSYRWLERYVSSRPGTFYFVRPVYGEGDLSDTPRYLEWGVLVEAGEGERLGEELAGRPEIEVLRPAAVRSRLEVAWLLGWFENFPAGEKELDLGVPGSAPPPPRPARGSAGNKATPTVTSVSQGGGGGGPRGKARRSGHRPRRTCGPPTYEGAMEL